MQLSRSIEGVMDAHDLRVRTSGGFYQAEIHIAVDGQLTVVEGHRIAKTVERCSPKTYRVEYQNTFSEQSDHISACLILIIRHRA